MQRQQVLFTGMTKSSTRRIAPVNQLFADITRRLGRPREDLGKPFLKGLIRSLALNAVVEKSAHVVKAKTRTNEQGLRQLHSAEILAQLDMPLWVQR